MYYFLGHMSKFAKPGARRLKSHVTGVYQDGGSTPSTAVPGSFRFFVFCVRFDLNLNLNLNLILDLKLNLNLRCGVR